MQIDWIESDSGFEMGRKDDDGGSGGIHLALGGSWLWCIYVLVVGSLAISLRSS